MLLNAERVARRPAETVDEVALPGFEAATGPDDFHAITETDTKLEAALTHILLNAPPG